MNPWKRSLFEHTLKELLGGAILLFESTKKITINVTFAALKVTQDMEKSYVISSKYYMQN